MPIIGFEDVSGDMFKALEEAGHGRRIIIADRFLDINRDRQPTVDYRGRSSAQALRTALKLVRREGTVTLMAPDRDDVSPLANRALEAFAGAVITGLHLPRLRQNEVLRLRRLGEEEIEGVGFYDIISDYDERQHLVIRTPDPLPYACATFIVGHSQFGEEINH